MTADEIGKAQNLYDQGQPSQFIIVILLPSINESLIFKRFKRLGFVEPWIAFTRTSNRIQGGQKCDITEVSQNLLSILCYSSLLESVGKRLYAYG